MKMESAQRPWKWGLLALMGLVVLAVVMLALGVLIVPPIHVERSPIPERTIAAPAQGEPVILPPVKAQNPSFLSLDPQNPIHIFVIQPLIAALVLLPLGGLGGIIWWVWLRPRNDVKKVYENGEEKAKIIRVRYILFGLP